MEWQPIETLPKDYKGGYLVFDGVGVWKAWHVNGFISGFEMDGYKLPHESCPPTHWMPLPEYPVLEDPYD